MCSEGGAVLIVNGGQSCEREVEAVRGEVRSRERRRVLQPTHQSVGLVLTRHRGLKTALLRITTRYNDIQRKIEVESSESTENRRKIEKHESKGPEISNGERKTSTNTTT